MFIYDNTEVIDSSFPIPLFYFPWYHRQKTMNKGKKEKSHPKEHYDHTPQRSEVPRCGTKTFFSARAKCRLSHPCNAKNAKKKIIFLKDQPKIATEHYAKIMHVTHSDKTTIAETEQACGCKNKYNKLTCMSMPQGKF